jgi:2-polyprenyl-3-methyl-5-hydroxy-6-metoxy-1,4-benzoquinol methylase
MSKHKNTLQGANNRVDSYFFRYSFPYIKNGDNILNLGCGNKFNFERNLIKKRKVKITSVDIIPIKKKPAYINNFVCMDVEKKIRFPFRYDVVTFFELIEHIDKTDILISNCYRNLKKGGYLIFSFPNLASIYSRIELLLGYQPHILEVSNIHSNFGTGFFGKINSPADGSLHHIRGITHKAMIELIKHYGFTVLKKIGSEYRVPLFFYLFPEIAPINIFICKKI